MPIVSTRSVVLQTYRYSDTSKILRLMTLDHGPRSVIAKGALRPRSKFGGVLEPFAEGEATIYLKDDRDLHTLSEFELFRERQALGVDLPRFAGASLACELVLRLAPEERDERLYRALLGALDALLEAEPADAEAVALAGVWRVVDALGFAPEMGRCVGCGSPIEEAEGARFDFAAGGLRCPGCPVGEGPWRRLERGEIASLRALGEGRRPPREVGPAQAILLRDFIRYHLAEGTNLRSLRFLGDRAFA